MSGDARDPPHARLAGWVTCATTAGIALVALVALVVWSFAERWSVLSGSPFPIGIDGYYYPLQLRSLLEHGHLLYPASPLTFWLAAPLAAVTDPVVGAKLLAALGGAAIAIPAYGVGARLGRGRGPGLVAAAAAVASCGSMYMSIEFVKNGVGLAIALAATWLVLRAIERRSRARIAAALVAITAAALAHVMAAALVVAICAPAVVADAVTRGALAGRRRAYAAIGALAAAAAVAAIAIAFPQRVPTLDGLVSAHAYWDLPALVLPDHELALGHEAGLGAVLAALAAIVLARRMLEQSAAERAASWAIVALALAIALPWLDVADPQGLAFRLRAAAFVPMALCAAIVARAALAKLGELRRELACAAIAIAVAAAPRDRHEGETDVPPYMVSAVMALDGKVPDGELVVVSERQVAYMAAWYARVAVTLRPSERARWRLMTLDGFIGRGSPLEHALAAARREPTIAPPIGLLARHPNGVVLVAEPTWRWLLAHLPPRPRAYYEAWPTM